MIALPTAITVRTGLWAGYSSARVPGTDGVTAAGTDMDTATAGVMTATAIAVAGEQLIPAMDSVAGMRADTTDTGEAVTSTATLRTRAAASMAEAALVEVSTEAAASTVEADSMAAVVTARRGGVQLD